MYLHIGQNELLPKADILGVFDLDACTAGKRTRAFLRRAETEGLALDVSGELPRSFVVCSHPYHEQIVWLSQLTSATLKRRWDQEKWLDMEEEQRGVRHGGE